jgi:hypothetical protein
LTLLLAPFLASGLAVRLAALALLVGGGLAAFAVLALALGAVEKRELFRFGRRS